MLYRLSLFFLCLLFANGAAAADRYIKPGGAGAKDGSSWANAMGTAHDGLQRAWDALGPGDTLWIGSGAYNGATLKIQQGGEPGRIKKIIGVDTGAGAPVFTGTFDRARPAKSGKYFFGLQAGAAHLRVENIQVNNYRFGFSGGGGLRDVRFINCNVTGCREGFSFDAHGGSQDLEFRGCRITHYTKRGMRFSDGHTSVTISDCHADGGGREWATEPFQMGFSIQGKTAREGAPDHDFQFIGCTARGNYNDAGGKYWNADGFNAEGGVYNVRYLDCRAFDNTDGGWDVKSTSTTLENCIALRNKRNFRLWGEARMINCVGAFSVHPGGTGSSVGLWTVGRVTAERCTFHDNRLGVSVEERGVLTLRHCIVSCDGAVASGELSRVEPEARLQLDETVLWKPGAGGNDPRLVNPDPNWDGSGDNFTSLAIGQTHGRRGE